ncbi:MAG: mitochondrial fission ELM1 family protein [Rickettsiales bacterium]|nr:mitochondrial fission ELM1 family protein [Rickettsiales bacterium]
MIYSKKICWIVTNSNAGVQSQALGLAEALGVKTEIKHVQRKFPFSLIPPIMKTIGRWSINFTTSNSNKLEAPWPDLVIACGAQSVHFCLYIKEKSKGKTFCIFLQDPKIPAENFDLVIKMKHDSITGPNVIASNLSLNRITPEKLTEESKKFEYLFKKYKEPFFTILIGGSTKRYKMSQRACEDIINKINTLIKENPNTSLLITPSRRTPKYLLDLLNQYFKDNKNIYLHDLNTKTNPYFAMLEKANKIFVTNDSVNMVSEACSTGKQVYVLNLLGLKKGKPIKFTNNILTQKIAHSFAERLSETKHENNDVNETQRIAKEIKAIFNKHC